MNITRIDDFTVQADDARKSRIYINENIELERAALEELGTFSQIEDISHLAFTADFHKGAGTPIGTVAEIERVYPRVVGNDIGCGMRLDVLGINALEVTTDLKDRLRGAFFEGQREVFVGNRSDLLAYGMEARVGGRTGERVPVSNAAYDGGAIGGGTVSDVLRPYWGLQSPRDNLLGSVGGGNHFVEIQQVDEIIDGAAAWQMGLRKGAYCVMVHSGSLDNGHQVGNHFKDLAKASWEGKHPANGYFPLGTKASQEYLIASSNAANFATVNRAVMAAMVSEVFDCDLRPVYDAPHNLVVSEGEGYLHRKGSCPARADEIVLIPGSMGTRSFVGRGLGFKGTRSSAPHGAGRVLNRNKARANVDDMANLEVVTKIDPARTRPDVASEVMKQLAEEAPRSYKDVVEVVASSEGAGLVAPVAWLRPVLTIKG